MDLKLESKAISPMKNSQKCLILFENEGVLVSMKKTISVFLAVVLLTSAFTVHAIAYDDSIDASHQIAGYSITITPLGSGNVRVVVSVAGTHPHMTTIGFPSIAIHERDNANSAWRVVRSSGPHYNPNALAGSHSHAITYQGVAGRQYRAHASFFAQDAQGSDSRQATSPIITAT
jgi:hypothetical protein